MLRGGALSGSNSITYPTPIKDILLNFIQLLHLILQFNAHEGIYSNQLLMIRNFQSERIPTCMEYAYNPLPHQLSIYKNAA